MKLPSHYLIVTFDGYAGAQPGIFQGYAQFTKPPASPPSLLTKVLNRVGLRLKPQRFNCLWNNMNEVKKFLVAFSGIGPTSQQQVTLFSLHIVFYFLPLFGMLFWPTEAPFTLCYLRTIIPRFVQVYCLRPGAPINHVFYLETDIQQRIWKTTTVRISKKQAKLHEVRHTVVFKIIISHLFAFFNYSLLFSIWYYLLFTLVFFRCVLCVQVATPLIWL